MLSAHVSPKEMLTMEPLGNNTSENIRQQKEGGEAELGGLLAPAALPTSLALPELPGKLQDKCLCKLIPTETARTALEAYRSSTQTPLFTGEVGLPRHTHSHPRPWPEASWLAARQTLSDAGALKGGSGTSRVLGLALPQHTWSSLLPGTPPPPPPSVPATPSAPAPVLNCTPGTRPPHTDPQPHGSLRGLHSES